MQSTRFLGASILRSQSSALNALKQRAMVPMQPVRGLRLQASPKMKMPVPKEEHSAHTISQRLRTLKKIPPELIPLGIVLAVAVGAAVYSLGRKFYVDKTLRLYRQGKHAAPVNDHH